MIMICIIQMAGHTSATVGHDDAIEKERRKVAIIQL